jgi:hypothetical protein
MKRMQSKNRMAWYSNACWLGILLILASGCGPSRQASDDPAKDPALVSAKAVARTFLNALQNQEGSSAYALLSTGAQERLSEEERTLQSMNVAVVDGQPAAAWIFGLAKLADSGKQATFAVVLRRQDHTQREFTLTLVQETAGSAWRVDSLQLMKN